MQPHLNAMDFRPCSGQPFAQMNKSGAVGRYGDRASGSHDEPTYISTIKQKIKGSYNYTNVASKGTII